MDYEELLRKMHKKNKKTKVDNTNTNTDIFLGCPFLVTNILSNVITNDGDVNIVESLETNLVLDVKVSLSLFYQYDWEDIQAYMEAYSLCQYLSIELQIMKLVSSNNLNVVIYTYWIKLIQRHWKNQCARNRQLSQELYEMRLSLTGRLNSELGINYGGQRMEQLPGLRGLLSMYNNILS